MPRIRMRWWRSGPKRKRNGRGQSGRRNARRRSSIITRGSIETGPKALLSSDAARIAGFDAFEESVLVTVRLDRLKVLFAQTECRCNQDIQFVKHLAFFILQSFR